jgi:hypothetical protein
MRRWGPDSSDRAGACRSAAAAAPDEALPQDWVAEDLGCHGWGRVCRPQPCRNPGTSRPTTIRDGDIARLSPLKHRNLNVLGGYSLAASTPPGGALRPLRDPDTVDLDEVDEG